MANNDIFMFVDEAGTDQNSAILVVACIITNDPDYLRRKLEELREDIIRDSFLKSVPSIQKSLQKKGFYYCEDHFVDVKPKVIDLIKQMPFEAYICYQKRIPILTLVQVMVGTIAFSVILCSSDFERTRMHFFRSTLNSTITGLSIEDKKLKKLLVG